MVSIPIFFISGPDVQQCSQCRAARCLSTVDCTLYIGEITVIRSTGSTGSGALIRRLG